LPISLAAQHVTGEAHEEADFLRAALPVLGGESIDRDVLDAQFYRSCHHVKQRCFPGTVALCTRQAALVGPPAIAIHDDSDVFRDQLAGNNWHLRVLRMREWCDGAATAGDLRKLLQFLSTRRSEFTARSKCH